MSFCDLPIDERPRERLLRLGASSLSLQELLAILLRTGQNGLDVMSLAENLLKDYPSEGALAQSTPAELCGFPGLGKAKAATILAAMELGKRAFCESKGEERSHWRSALRALEKTMSLEEREFILALLTDRKGVLLGVERISFGGLDGAFLDAPFLCRRAVRIKASGVVLVHNHPDGTLEPSEEDRSLTSVFSKQMKLLGIELIGHFVIAGGFSRPIDVH